MSGDVQPRKRKDKKKKKDELGVEEHRGTAAVLGEGDVFMHSQHEHGTGGHWCAKIIFFSLLAVLITLIGLIILENRGLTELEANSVESRYSGVLDGWLEDAPDDDHHDEHTLELLKHHNEEDDHFQENDVSEEDHGDDDEQDEEGHDDHEDDDDERNADEHDDEDDDDDADEDDQNEKDIDEDEQEISLEDHQEQSDEVYNDGNQSQQDDEDSEELYLDNTEEDDDNDDEHENNNYENDDSYEEDDHNDIKEVDEVDNNEDNSDDDFQNDQEKDQTDENDLPTRDADDNDIEEHEEHEEERSADIEVEKLEKEVSDEDQPSQEVEENNETQELPLDEGDDVDSVEDEKILEADDVEEPLPVIERIVVPKGKPLVEVEDEPTNVKPSDTLAEEEEYEKQQEELRREEAQASHVWLKLVVGGALLVATHAVISRVVAPRDSTPASEDHDSREDTPSTIDRRMTLIPQELAATATPRDIIEGVRPLMHEEIFEKESHIYSQNDKSLWPQENEEEETICNIKDVTSLKTTAETEEENKELYSDEDEMDADDKMETVVDDVPHRTTHISNEDFPATETVVEPVEPETDDVPDDVEIIDDDQLEEELEEEEEVEEEISDVDDAELLSRLEAKYGRLPEPERPGQKHKDGGNNIEDEWPGEPSDKYWRQQLDEAEEELRQDWLD